MTEPFNAIEEAERAGFDMGLIDANLSYSYEKRMLLHDAALETDLGAVDLLSSIQGVGDFARVRADSIEIDLSGVVAA
jgi:hypothetical protein